MTTATDANQDIFMAQYGEDRMIWEFFSRRARGFYIEVGAWNGYHFSNTYALEKMGWNGILIEPIPEMAQSAVELRPNSKVIHAACTRPGNEGTTSFTVVKGNEMLSCIEADEQHRKRCLDSGASFVEIEVPALTLDTIIADSRHHPWACVSPWVQREGWSIDVVTIDVEGGEMDVLAGFNLGRFKPIMLVVENERPSGAQIELYLREQGYVKVHRQVINDFYLRQDVHAMAMQATQ